MAQTEKDALTGTETTGHEWDGIKELDTPMPKWWLYTFYATVIWAVGYWVLYPAWPSLNDYTKGILGYSSRAQLTEELAAAKQAKSQWLDRFETASVEEIVNNKDLLNFALAGGDVLFADNCAPCHGSGGQGAPGYPVLADDAWIWGGSLEAIKTTVQYGVRADHPDTRYNVMPTFEGILEPQQIEAVAEYVLSLSGQSTNQELAQQGETPFVENCAACHGEDGQGIDEMGGPNLADNIWLYKGTKEGVINQVVNPKNGVMPAWTTRLGDAEIKQVTVYVHSLGGGR